MHTPPFDISTRAITEARAIMERKAVPEGYALRVGIRGSAGCAGVAYLIGFDRPTETDLAFDLEGLNVVMEKKHALYLAGVKVDFVDEPDRRGFAFSK